ncbi:ROK family transcriptional regulator, partial [Actinomyces slackii]
MRRGSNLPRVGSFNRAVVLEAIRGSSRGLTRAQLGRRTRLAPQTVSNVVKELLDTQLIEEAGTLTRGGRGRPGTRLRLNPSARFAVGVHLDPAWLGIVAVDLSGAVIAEVYEPLPSPDQPAAVTRHLASRIEAAIGLTGLPRERLLGVGVAAPGPLDEEAGTVSPPLLPGWHRIPLRGALAELTGATVLLEKDIIAAATAHTWRDAASGTADYAFLYVGAGVALATVLGSEVVRG